MSGKVSPESKPVGTKSIESVKPGEPVKPKWKTARYQTNPIRIRPRITALVNSHLILRRGHLRLERHRASAPEIKLFTRTHVSDLLLRAVIDLGDLATALFSRRQT
jgi:hypothetical protein